MSSKRGLQIALNAVGYTLKAGGHDTVLKPLKIISAGDGRCTAELTVTRDLCNPYGSIHGGYTATMVDNFSTYGLMTTDAHPGVTVSMYINYFNAAKKGDVVIVEGSTVKVGSKFAFVECELRRKSDGTIIARGGQTKFIDLPKGDMTPLYDVK